MPIREFSRPPCRAAAPTRGSLWQLGRGEVARTPLLFFVDPPAGL